MDENKEELFLYFVEQLTTTGTGHGEVVSSKGESVLLNNENDDTAEVAPCKHKELIRGILHAADAANFGYNKLMVHPVDIVIVVITIMVFQHVSLLELWIEFRKEFASK